MDSGLYGVRNDGVAGGSGIITDGAAKIIFGLAAPTGYYVLPGTAIATSGAINVAQFSGIEFYVLFQGTRPTTGSGFVTKSGTEFVLAGTSTNLTATAVLEIDAFEGVVTFIDALIPTASELTGIKVGITTRVLLDTNNDPSTFEINLVKSHEISMFKNPS